MAVKVGNFAKTTEAATASQSVTGIGFLPKALILWTSGTTAAGTHDNYNMSIGITTGAAASGSIAAASQDLADPTNTSRATAAKALTIIEWGETVLAECDLASFDADGFTLSWTTNNANATIIHYMALGGSDLTNANVVSWAMPTSAGNKSVTGVGFQPDCVFHIWTHETGNSVGASVANGCGVMTTADEWASSWNDNDNAASVASSSQQSTDNCFYRESTGSALDLVAAYVSMDADGFTVNFSNEPVSAHKVYSICLKGGSYKVGTFNKTGTTDPVSQDVTGIGFTPEGVFFQSICLALDSEFVNDGIFMFGGSDGTNEVSAAVSSDHGVAAAVSNGYLSNTKGISLIDKNGALRAECDVINFASDQFTANWAAATVNNAFRVRYIAFGLGAAPTGQPMQLRGTQVPSLRHWHP